MLNSVCAAYDGAQVLHDVTFSLQSREILAVLGRNGAGKTSLLRAILGLLPTTSGRIELDGDVLSELAPHEVPGRGVAYVPQGRRLFPELTVRENLEMGLLVRGAGPKTLDWVLELFPVLKDRLRQRAGTLSGGQQQMVATARALCAQPRLLLLDEPSEGLQPSLVETLMQTVASLKEQDVCVLLVEQKVDAALAIADRVLFIENGACQAETTPSALKGDPSPLRQYVGIQR